MLILVLVTKRLLSWVLLIVCIWWLRVIPSHSSSLFLFPFNISHRFSISLFSCSIQISIYTFDIKQISCFFSLLVSLSKLYSSICVSDVQHIPPSLCDDSCLFDHELRFEVPPSTSALIVYRHLSYCNYSSYKSVISPCSLLPHKSWALILCFIYIPSDFSSFH